MLDSPLWPFGRLCTGCLVSLFISSRFRPRPRATSAISRSAQYLPSCRTSGYPAPTNFESVSSVLLTRSAENGAVKSSWICSLPLCHVPLVSVRRQWIATPAASKRGCRQSSSDRAREVYQKTDQLLTYVAIRGGADKSLPRTTSRCRTELIVLLERGVFVCQIASLFLL